MLKISLLAASYDCDAYGAGTYNNSSCATPTTTTSPLDSALAYTGTPMFAITAVAVVIIVVSLAILLKRRRKP